MISTQNSIQLLEVGKNVNRTANVTALDQTTSTYAANGEIVVINMAGTVLNTTTVQGVDKIKIFQSRGTTDSPIISPTIELAGIKTYSSKAYTAPTLQVSYVGYDASVATGDIDVISNNGYEIRIHDLNSVNWGSIGTDVYGMYVSDNSATKAEINDGLAVNLWQNTVRLVKKPFIVERVSAATFTASTAATGTATYTKDSATVTTSGVTPVTDFPVGSYVRIGTTATTVLTLPVYKVIASSNSTQTITLDQPFQGSSSTGATTAFAFATAATVNASALGIKMSGQAMVYSIPQSLQSTQPYMNAWETNVGYAGNTTVTTPTKATRGSGYFADMASWEYFLVGNRGFIERNNIPYVYPPLDVLATGTYNILSLEWDSVKTGQVFNQQAASKQLDIAFDFTPASAPTQVTGVVTAVQDVLNSWIPSTIGTGTLS